MSTDWEAGAPAPAAPHGPLTSPGALLLPPRATAPASPDPSPGTEALNERALFNDAERAPCLPADAERGGRGGALAALAARLPWPGRDRARSYAVSPGVGETVPGGETYRV